ncbi:MAG: peptidylprolyl isomerase [Dehalococcoidia bacterium]
MAKKQKKATSEQAPSKRQLSKWQRQMRIRRIVIIAAAVFLVGIASWVGYGYYKDYKSNPSHEVVIEVNGVPFTMGYYINTLGIYVQNYINNYVNTYVNLYMQAYPNTTREDIIQQLTSDVTTGLSQNTNNITDTTINTVADDIINDELLRQGAKSLNITVTTAEINAALKQYGLPSNSTYPDIVRASLLEQKVKDYFGSQLPATMEQADVQVMLVESQEVANEVITKVEAGGNFTALAANFSYNSTVEGDLGWLPAELMPNTRIASAAFVFAVGDISQPIYDETAIKDVGYWLIEVTGKQGDAINASAMLLGSEVEAEQVKAQLAAGGNFSALAENYSQDKSKDAGGKLDGLKRGDMGSTAFDAVAFNLTLNKVSEPVKDTSVQTTGGYWLVKVIDRGDHQLSDSVKQQLIDNHYNDWLGNLANQGTINTYLDSAKKAYAINQVLAGM